MVLSTQRASSQNWFETNFSRPYPKDRQKKGHARICHSCDPQKIRDVYAVRTYEEKYRWSKLALTIYDRNSQTSHEMWVCPWAFCFYGQVLICCNWSYYMVYLWSGAWDINFIIQPKFIAFIAFSSTHTRAYFKSHNQDQVPSLFS